MKFLTFICMGVLFLCSCGDTSSKQSTASDKKLSLEEWDSELKRLGEAYKVMIKEYKKVSDEASARQAKENLKDHGQNLADMSVKVSNMIKQAQTDTSLSSRPAYKEYKKIVDELNAEHARLREANLLIILHRP